MMLGHPRRFHDMLVQFKALSSCTNNMRWVKYTTNYCIFLHIYLLKMSCRKNIGKAISMTLNLKMVWGNMPPSPLVWSPKGTVTFLLMWTPSKSDTTPLQRLEAVTQSLFSGLESNFKVKSPSKIQWNEAMFGSSPG